MTLSERDSLSLRVLILAPTGRDAALTVAALGTAGVDSILWPYIEWVERDIAEGAGALLCAAESFANGGLPVLAAALSRQEAWSDLPVLLLSRYGADSTTVANSL